MSSRRGSMSVSAGRRPSRPCVQGVLLIELMIGISIGLLIAAAAVTFVAGHLNDNRRLLLESRLMQDLRTAADIVARDLRRAGYWAVGVRRHRARRPCDRSRAIPTSRWPRAPPPRTP